METDIGVVTLNMEKTEESQDIDHIQKDSNVVSNYDHELHEEETEEEKEELGSHVIVDIKPNEDRDEIKSEEVVGVMKVDDNENETENQEKFESEIVVNGNSTEIVVDNSCEKVCRICLLALDDEKQSSELIKLGCGCKDELGISHGECAKTWFNRKGNRTCEICGMIVKNIAMIVPPQMNVRTNMEMIEQWRNTHLETRVNVYNQSSCSESSPYMCENEDYLRNILDQPVLHLKG